MPETTEGPSLDETEVAGRGVAGFDRAYHQGDRIGRYLVLSTLGQGAMGTVYAGYDPELDRKVAIKLVRVRGGRYEEAHRSRLLREAQALARITHANVVTVHDVGTQDGRVYVAMEFIDGQTLREWLDLGPRPWAEVIATFRQAGLGLAAAHREQLVHRDFKPQNVMVVASTGRVVVLDFGLARDPEAGEKFAANSIDHGGVEVEVDGGGLLTTEITRVGELTGTPAYMSPEQFSGERVDATSDQFSFCVALYEGLYGARPFRGDSPAALALSVSEGSVRGEDPGRGIPARIRRAVLRGLEVNPSARWPTMHELLDALEPRARGSTRLWTIVGAAVVLGGALVFGLAVRDDGARLCSGSDAQLAQVWDAGRREQIGEHLGQLELGWLDESWPLARDRLDAYAQAWSTTHREACEATTIRGEQSERILDSRMACLGRARIELAAVSNALLVSDEQELLRIHELVGGLPPIERCSDVAALNSRVILPGDGETRARVESMRAKLAEQQVVRRSGRPEALDHLLAMNDEILAIDHPPLHAEYHVQTGEAARFAGRMDEARARLESGLELALALGQWNEALAALKWLTLVSGSDQQQPRESMVFAKVAAGIALQPGVDRGSARLAAEAMAAALEGAGKYDEALETYERVLKGVPADREIERADHLSAIGRVLEIQGRTRDAEAAYRSVLETHATLLGDNHPALAQDWGNIGNALFAQDRYAEAEEAHRRALALDQAAFGPEHPRLAASHANLGSVMAASARYEEAGAEYRIVLSIIGEEHPRSAMVHGNLGTVAMDQGDYVLAEVELRTALERYGETIGLEHPRTVIVHSLLGLALDEQDRHEEARIEHELASKLALEAYPEGHAIIAKTRERTGYNLLERGRSEEAVELLELALADRIEEEGDPSNVASVKFVLARALWHSNRDRARAIELAREAERYFAETNEKRASEVRAWLSSR